MRSKIVIILLVVAGAGLAWFAFYSLARSQNTLPPEITRVLDSGQKFILLSLDPTHPAMRPESAPPPQETFHDYAVLGKTEIRDVRQRADLLRALYQGIADSDGSVAGCFNPRHGISATLGDETVDLVICFECLSLQAHAKTDRNVLTSRSPEPTFNSALQTAGLPIAKKQ